MNESEQDFSDELIRRLGKVAPFEPLSKEIYSKVLFGRYNQLRGRLRELPPRVPNVVVEAVRTQINSKPDSNLRECLQALEIGVSEFIQSNFR